ncbi:MAG: PIN domain-containing protein, partial [Phycisphaerales bacterium JB059]
MPVTCLIDTCIFVQARMHFDIPGLQALRHRCRSGSTTLLCTDITNREIARKCEEAAESVAEQHEKFRKHVLSKIAITDELKETLFGTMPTAQIADTAKHEYATLLSDCEAVLLEAKHARPDMVMDAHFNCRPPFGKGKKRNEFRDAFVIDLLEQHHAKTGDSVHIISDDEDLHQAADERDWLTAHTSIFDFLDETAPEGDEL